MLPLSGLGRGAVAHWGDLVVGAQTVAGVALLPLPLPLLGHFVPPTSTGASNGSSNRRPTLGGRLWGR